MCFVSALVNGFYSTPFISIAIYIVLISYSYHQDGPGAFYSYSAGIIVTIPWCTVSQCIIAVSCSCTLIGAIYNDKLINILTQQMEAFKLIIDLYIHKTKK